MRDRFSYMAFRWAICFSYRGSPMTVGITFCGSVVEQTSSILSSTMLFMYFAKTGSLSALYTSIHPHRAPGQGSSLEIPFMEIPHTPLITSAKGTDFLPL